MGPDPLEAELTEVLGSRREARWLLEEVRDLEPGARRTRALELARRRADGEPLQYLLGHWPFRSLDLIVDDRALIPRPETEALVGVALERLLDTVPRGGAAVVCDLGCGTGAIGLSLAVEAASAGRTLEVHATDRSARALSLARQNARRAGVARIQFHEGDWYAALPASLRGAVDLVCANPPYVARSERAGLDRELDFEPHDALVADDGTSSVPGFGAVEAVVRGAPDWLADGGWLVVEHGESHRAAALRCAAAAGLGDPVDLDDLSGRPRVLVARRTR